MLTVAGGGTWVCRPRCVMAATGASFRARNAKRRDDGDLPAELTQARRFGKTRSAQSTALLEDYVELIADLLASAGEARPTDIARRLGVSHATAIKTISRPQRAGMAWASTCCRRSGCRPKPPKPTPKGSSITFRRRA